MDIFTKMREIRRKDAKFNLLLFIIVGGGMIFFARRAKIANDKENFQWDFKGSIQYVEYDEKNYPIIYVNDKKYDLGGLNVDNKIEKGDSIIKQKNSYIYTVIKHDSKVKMQFEY